MSRGTIASTFHTYTMTSFTSGDQFMFSSDSSDDEEELMMMVAIEEEELRTQGRTRHRGSVLGHAVIDRGHQEGAARLFRDYFSNNPVYGDILFRRRYAHLPYKHNCRLSLVINDCAPYQVSDESGFVLENSHCCGEPRPMVSPEEGCHWETGAKPPSKDDSCHTATGIWSQF